MICPHCKKELIVPGRAEHNVTAYRQKAVVTAECCGKGIVMTPVFHVTVEKYTGDRKEDDWGVPISNDKE